MMAVRNVVDLGRKIWHENSQASILAVKADTLEVILRNFIRDLCIAWAVESRAPKTVKDTHQWLIVIKHKEKVHQGPVLACIGGRHTGLGWRPAFV
jgi:hypothetical protein